MWKAIGVTLALLLAILLLTELQGGKAGLDPTDQLAFERQRAERRRHLGSAVTTPVLDCVASRATPATVETLYRVWINRRADTTTTQERDAADAEIGRSIAACGADFTVVETDAHRSGIDLGEASALAMLKAGK